MFHSRPVLSGLVFLLAVALIGCGDPQSSTNWSRARVVNALVGIPNGAGANVASSHDYPTVTNVPFGGVTQYVQGGLGETSVTATQTGTNTVIAPTTQVTLGTQQSNTIVVSGVIGGQGTLAPRIYRLIDTAPPTNFASTNPQSVNFAVKVYNLSPDSPAINFEGGNGVVPGLNNISYGNASNYVIISAAADKDPKTGAPLPFATVSFTINDTVTGADLHAKTLSKLGGVTNGEIFTVFVTGMVNPVGQQQALDTNISEGVF
jgi:hypothetical protein